jgi:hypothetical protein
MNRSLTARRARPRCVPAGAVLAQEQDLTVLARCRPTTRRKQTAWGEPDFRGGWPIDHLNGRTPLQRDPKYGNRAYLTDEEFAARDAAVQQLAQRYQNEDSQGEDGHRPLGRGRQRQPADLVDHLAGQRAAPEYTAEGKRLSARCARAGGAASRSTG